MEVLRSSPIGRHSADGSPLPIFSRAWRGSATGRRSALGGISVRKGAGQKDGSTSQGGIVPIASSRFHALSNGITISATLDRLVAAEEVGGLDGETAQSLREAFTIVCDIRIKHHAACIRAGAPPDNLIDPDTLHPLERASLREAFLAVTRAQKQLGRYVPLGL